MSPHQKTKFTIAAAWTGIVLAGLAAGTWSVRTREATMLAQLLADAARSAIAFDPAVLNLLSGKRADLGTPAFVTVKARLRQLEAVDPRVRFVYVFRAKPEAGKVLFLAGSAKPGAKDESLPGDDYPQAPKLPGLQEILRTGRPATEGPLADDFGTWMTAYALISAAPSPGGGTVVKEILGLDRDAAGWRQELWRAGFQAAFLVWIFLGLPLAAWLVLRRQHEQREAIRNLSEAMEQSHSALMVVDLDSSIEYANRGLCQQIGYTRRELIGRKWREFQVAETAPEVLAELVTTVRAGQAWEGEWFNRRKDGGVYPVRGVVTPVKKRDGSISCFVAVFDDMTEIKRKEAELRDARDHAQAGDRAKGQFLATMSHEVRTPLNGIVGFTNLLLDTPLSGEQRECAQTIRMSTEALIQLTGDILDFARIESGKLKLDPLPCDPRECVEDALDLLAAKATEKSIELVHHIAPDVPAAVVTDGGRLRQILVNLVGNAVKFSEQGEVEVSVQRRPILPAFDGTSAVGPGSEEACLLEFSVRDTGIGIAAEHHGKLFRPFTQVDNSTTRRHGGTGLGLAICRNLVELLGGTINVVSEPGKGSTFRFTVRAAVAAPPPPPGNLGGAKLGLAILPGPLRRELTALVRAWSGEVIEAETPEQLAPSNWEMALIDVGIDFARELTGQNAPIKLPPEKCIGIVPISLPNDLRTALRGHFRLLVNKPIHHDALFALLTGSRTSFPAAVRSTNFGLRVLVVEDNVVNQRLIQRVLTRLGCTSKLVENGREALTFLKEHAAEIDVVLLDMHMPEMDGLAALKEIRAGKAGPRAQTMWIIALTADAREQQRTQALEAGLNDYLTKPLALVELETALKRFRTEHGARKL
ncbi:MAG: response regulator [Opitutus sp.]|nr:response regulator [Opitutus sp.]